MSETLTNEPIQTVYTSADAGSVRVSTAGTDIHLPNGRGDGRVQVQIFSVFAGPGEGWDFSIMFTLREPGVVTASDCDEDREPACSLRPGRYQAFYLAPANNRSGEDQVAIVRV